MSLIDRTNPSRWADGEPRSQNNGFVLGFCNERIDTRAMQITENRRRGSSNGVETRRARGPQSGSKAQQLRDALAAGPMTSRELSTVTGIHMDLVPSLLQWSIHNGQIRALRASKPYRYAMPTAPQQAPGRYSPDIEGQAAGQKSSDKRAALRRGSI